MIKLLLILLLCVPLLLAVADFDRMNGVAVDSSWTFNGVSGAVEINGGGAVASAGWTDPYAADLDLRFWFDPTATNAIGEVIDSSGQGNNGSLLPTPAGGPTWTIIGTNTVAGSPNVGRVEHANSFDGADDYINIASCDMEEVTNGLTVALWVKRDSDDRYEAIVELVDGVESFFRVDFTSGGVGTLRAIAYTDGDESIYVARTGADFNSGDGWVHVAATYQAVSNIVIYTNGVEVTTTPISNGAFVSIGHSATARIYTGGATKFDGMLDDIRIYPGVVLTAGEVADIYSETKKPDDSDENGY